MQSLIIVSILAFMISSCSILQKRNSANDAKQQGGITESADTTRKPRAKPQPYNQVISGHVVTDDGLIMVHKIDDRYFFEIADSLLDKDMLIVNRISKASVENRPLRHLFGYGGDYIGENVIRLTKGPDDRIFIKRMQYTDIRSTDSSENGMYRSVKNSSMQPLVAAFDIRAYNPRTKAIVIDITDYINGDNDVMFFSPDVKKMFNLETLQPDKSYTEKISSFPANVEIRTIKTFAAGASLFTYELNSSLVLLPTFLMKPRYADQRIGYFGRGYIDMDVVNPQGFRSTWMITRWRLEPKEQDIQKYLNGELVEPKKPIVYYIDPATPKKWVPYLIQGVNDWQQAFEKAGFKNAIYALEAPVNNPEWSLDDARHNAIVYKPSPVSNASGPHVNDPRTGEILETHINWYHNITELLRNWYFVQCAVNDPRARKAIFDDTLMGKLIRFVSTHEVGHTLGLMHNFGASSTVPVEKMRDKKWVEANGFCPSIMDYARFNYVAQPSDSISEAGLMPRIGPYDEWAIEWGYRWFPQFGSQEAEKEFMNKWIVGRLEKDKRLFYSGLGEDPRSQAEDLGDDAVKAGYYGIENLKRTMPKLSEWTRVPNSNYATLEKMELEVKAQFQRYLMHVSPIIGGVYKTAKTVEQAGPVVEFVDRNRQIEALNFFDKQLFTTPEWLLNEKDFSLTGGSGFYHIIDLQRKVLNVILSQNTVTNLLFFETLFPVKAFTYAQLLDKMEEIIWKDLDNKKPIDIYRRNLQKVYVEQLASLGTLDEKEMANFAININTDVPSLAKNHIRHLLSRIKQRMNTFKDNATKAHLTDLSGRLQKMLDIGIVAIDDRQKNGNSVNGNNKSSALLPGVYIQYNLTNSLRQECWY